MQELSQMICLDVETALRMLSVNPPIPRGYFDADALRHDFSRTMVDNWPMLAQDIRELPEMEGWLATFKEFAALKENPEPEQVQSFLKTLRIIER